MSRGGGGGGLIEGIIELAVALFLLYLLLHFAYEFWLAHWGFIVGGAAVIGGALLFVHWLGSRGSGW